MKVAFCFKMEEIWKDVKGFEGIYQISNKGRLASFYKGGFHVLSNKNSKGSYFSVVLHGNNGERKSTRIHRLVYEAFIGEIPKGHKYHYTTSITTSRTIELKILCSLQRRNIIILT